jgi:hypothetical protein
MIQWDATSLITCAKFQALLLCSFVVGSDCCLKRISIAFTRAPFLECGDL